MIKDLFYEHQRDAIKRLRSGSILVGGVGSGKSRTSIGFFLLVECGGVYDKKGDIVSVKRPKPLYIITTARKRDTLDWEKECLPFKLSKDPKSSFCGIQVTIDSWNNIGKYVSIKNTFFIFDEQRVVGSGAWSKYFIKIAKANHWILLSATPGDTWLDYIPVFIANGFYKYRSEFLREHVVFCRYTKFPKVDRYLNTQKLERLRDAIVVPMEFKRSTVHHTVDIKVDYDKATYMQVMKKRWNPYENEPIQNISALCYTLRRVVNSDSSRLQAIIKLVPRHPKLVVFYNFNYELEALRTLKKVLKGYTISEWNGQNHQPVPKTDKWLYLVQYTAGAEGWNCTETDAIAFYSLNYSYKIMTQAAGRIDRLTTKFHDLFYYYIASLSSIDRAIRECLDNKEDFNDSMFKHADRRKFPKRT